MLNPAEFAASYDAPSKQLRCTVTSPAGYASMIQETLSTVLVDME